ncbi:hypothetical protein RJG79_04030 [Mycoplasmatota bacterium WC44]
MFKSFDWSKLINVSNVSAFLIGIFLGLFIAGIFYALLVLKAIKKTEKIKLRMPKSTDEAECLAIVERAKKDYKQRKRYKSIGERFLLTRDLSERIAYDIARYHFPDSKQPFLEISTYELLESIKYICSRIETILEKRPLNRLKDLSGIQVLTMFEFTDKVKENKTLQLARKATESSVVKAAKGVMSVFSPSYFIRNTVVNSTLNLSIDTLCLVVLNIVGEEVYKVYSKKLFNKDVDGILDDEINKLLEEGMVNDV